MRFFLFLSLLCSLNFCFCSLSLFGKFIGPSSTILDVLENVKSAIEKTAWLPFHTLHSSFINTGNASSPEFKWIPAYQGAGKPGRVEKLAKAPCFQENSVEVTRFDDTGATLELKSSTQSSWFCSDFLMIATLENIKFVENFGGTQVITWEFEKTISQAEMNDIKRNGFRVFAFQSNVATTLYQLYETILLFLPGMTSATLSSVTEEQNAAFLKNMVQYDLEKRSIYAVDLEESEIQDGDMFGILRLDGLDPMLAWAMGSRTGHTVVAIRVDGDLKLCEATTNSSYWPTNGIQCTPYKQWVVQARKASQNVVHLPLSAEFAAKFNSSAAFEFFKRNEGLNYGYFNLLWGWMDNIQNYMYTLAPETHMVIPALVGKLAPSVADLLWNQAFKVRLGIAPNDVSMDTAMLYDYAFAVKGWDFNDLAFHVENDNFEYWTQKNDGEHVLGRSMVCNVFVCSIWKAGGLFADQPDFQCSETTNWDIEALKIFNSSYVRPHQCVTADPDSQFCQISGNWRIKIESYNARWPITPNAFANCPRGDPPLYTKPYPC